MFFSHTSRIQDTRARIKDAASVFVLTGAGISVASGIPTFRGKSGLYAAPELLAWAFPESHERDPAGGWRAFEEARALIARARPNAAHEALAAFARGRNVRLFTQNVDGLHERSDAAAREIHGTLRRYRCRNPSCDFVKSAPAEPLPEIACCDRCGEFMRHDVVLFGERVRHVAALHEAIARCEIVLFVGTSGFVTDTRSLARAARRRGSRVIEIDPAWLTRATLWTHRSIRLPAEEALPLLLNA